MLTLGMSLSLVRPIPARAFPRGTVTSVTRFVSTAALHAVLSGREEPLLEGDLSYIRHNPSQPKPRVKGLSEIRAAYYTVMGPNYLSDSLGTMGHWVDGLQFAGGSHTLFPEHKLRECIDLAHSHEVYVSTGGRIANSTRLTTGFIEHLLTHPQPVATVEKYLAKCKDLGFRRY